MNMNMHIARTWCWANLLHPFILAVYFGIGDYPSAADLFGYGFMFIAFSFLFSLPSLFISWFIVYLISSLKMPPETKFILWLIATPLITILNFILIIILCGGRIGDVLELEIFMPAIIAVVMVVLVRYRSFITTILLPEKEL